MNSVRLFIMTAIASLFVSSLFAVDLSLGRRAVLDAPELWEEWRPGLTNPSDAAWVRVEGQASVFCVPDVGHEMNWKQSLRPVWLDFHHYLTIGYIATGISTQTVSPLVRLCTGLDAWNTALFTNQIQVDGAHHVQTIDLSFLLASSLQVSGVQIHLSANASTTATLTIDQFDFTDVTPGFEYPLPQSLPPAEVGFELDLTQVSSWKARPDWLSSSNISSDYSVSFTGNSLLFSVNDANKGMKWQNMSIGSQDTGTYNYVLMRYRCRNIKASTSNYAIWLSGSGESRPFYQADIIDDGAWRWGAAPISITSTNQMAIQVQSDVSGNAFIEIAKLQFVAGDPRIDLSYYTTLETGWDSLTSGTAGFSMIDLSTLFNAKADQLLPRMSLNVPWFSNEEISADNRIPFRIRCENPNLVATDIAGLSSVTIPIGQSACEVYFLLGIYLPGRENSTSDEIVSVIDETERFYVKISYMDGTHEDFFPVDVASGLHKIPNRTFCALACPADPSKIINSIKLYDFMDGGLFALSALTLNVSGNRFYEEAFEIPLPETVVAAPEPSYIQHYIQHTTDSLILENTYARYGFDLAQGFVFRELVSHFTGHNINGTATSPSLFTLTLDGSTYSSLDLETKSIDIRTSGDLSIAEIGLDLKGREGIIGMILTAQIDSTPETQFSLLLENNDVSSHSLELRFPDLSGMKLGPDGQNIHYAYPSETFILGDSPLDVEQCYSGKFPMQFMDIYDAGQGWGVYLLVKDLSLINKYYRLKKGSNSASIAVRYPTLSRVGLPAGGRMEIAPFVLGFHSGDWHQAMTAYCQWVSTWYVPKSPRQKWFQEIYTCRRDYPISGSGYLFDRVRNQYTFPAEIANAAQFLGGADMIDISSWGWSATYGRVGDYRRYELGGLENFRDGIALAQGQGIPVGLYIEGYALDDRSTIYQAHGEEWKLILASGQDSRDGHEVIICPHVAAWQDYMKELYSAVVAETGAYAMYIDVFGLASPAFTSCYSPTHGHPVGQPPLRGEFEMTRKIREGLNSVRQGIPLYTEYTPADVISQYQDGSFSYTIWYGDNEISPTETNLFRFCFPDFKQIELVNGMFLARNWTEEGLKKACFNGEGIWVKGDLASWYDSHTIEFYKKSHELFSEHADAFTSDSIKPFLPALMGNIFVHRFGSGDKQVFTFYNANWRGVSGPLVGVGVISDAHVVDLWGEHMLDSVGTSANYAIQAGIFPRDIGCVGIFKRLITATCVGNMINITQLSSKAGTHLELVGIRGSERQVKSFINPAPTLLLDLNTYFAFPPEKVIVKLKHDDILLDEVILDLPGNISEVKGWHLY